MASEINAGMAWAPEAIYDEATGEYLVFWSSGKTNGNGNYVYVAKTRDFWNFTEAEYDALMDKWGTPKQEGNRRPVNEPVLTYDFEDVNGQTVNDVSSAGAENHGILSGDAVVTEAEGMGKVLELKGSGKLSFPQGFFEGLSNMTICMDVCAQSDSATVFSMGSTVKNKISSCTVSSGADGEIVEEKERFWDRLLANKYLNLDITAQGVNGQITTFNNLRVVAN